MNSVDFTHLVREQAKAHLDGYSEALKWMREPEDIEKHENEIKVSVGPVDVERAAELELMGKLVDLLSAVLVKERLHEK